jgi:hypothetical protein
MRYAILAVTLAASTAVGAELGNSGAFPAPKVAPRANQTPQRPNAVQAYLAQPLNVGRCPCGATGFGCHCLPASACGREPCELHSPILAAQKQATKAVQLPTFSSQAQPVTILPTSAQSCPPGGCPQSQASGRAPLIPRLFRR